MSDTPADPSDENVVPFEAAATTPTASAPASSSSSAPAAAEVDVAAAFETKKGTEEYFFNEEGRHFLRKNAAGSWISLSEGAFIRHLKKEHGLNDKAAAGKITSRAHDVVHDV